MCVCLIVMTKNKNLIISIIITIYPIYNITLSKLRLLNIIYYRLPCMRCYASGYHGN